MKKVNGVIAFAAVFLPITAMWSCGMIEKDKTIAVNEMNRKSEPYQATGCYAMVDRENNHIGIYSGSTAAAHFWAEGFSRVRPGYYILSVCESWIELCMDKTDAVYVIRMNDKDLKRIKEQDADMIPVIVY